MIDRKWIGYELPDSVMTIERSRLQFFAKAIGETNPVYTDLAAARAAGYADLPAPPTFLFGAELDSGASDRLVADLGIPFANLLHGEQRFAYHHPACAGDKVTVRSKVTDVYARKGGALEFVVKSSHVTNEAGVLLAEMRTVLVYRH
jgi:acyl dehydratase